MPNIQWWISINRSSKTHLLRTIRENPVESVSVQTHIFNVNYLLQHQLNNYSYSASNSPPFLHRLWSEGLDTTSSQGVGGNKFLFFSTSRCCCWNIVVTVSWCLWYKESHKLYLLFSWPDEEGRGRKKCLFPDHVYHLLYNYHLYWIFTLSVTKEPSAHCSSSPLELPHQPWDTGNNATLPTPPLNQLKSERSNPRHIFSGHSGLI